MVEREAMRAAARRPPPAKPPAVDMSMSLGLDLLSHFTERERDLFTSSSSKSGAGVTKQASGEPGKGEPILRGGQGVGGDRHLEGMAALVADDGLNSQMVLSGAPAAAERTCGSPPTQMMVKSEVKAETLQEMIENSNAHLLASQIVPHACGLTTGGAPLNTDLRRFMLGDDVSYVMAAVSKGQDPRLDFTMEELLSLLWSRAWDPSGRPPPARPLLMDEPLTRVLFREPSRHKRRQKLSVGSIDRWKNSGGKKAVITIPIPYEYQRPVAQGLPVNVIIQRHGRVLRPEGGLLRYRQWSFGVRMEDGSGVVRETKTTTEHMLYQVHTETGGGEFIHTTLAGEQRDRPR